MKSTNLRTRLAAILGTSFFQNAIIIVIVFNSIILGLETSDSIMARYGGLLNALDMLCLAIFVVEILAKLYVERGAFFRSGWNLFDSAIVAISLAPVGEGFSILRALRILRVFRLVSIIPEMRRVTEGFLRALPGMNSVFLMVGLIFYVASILATKFYGDSFPEWFGTMGRSAYTLFQVMTLESWSMGIVRPVMEVHPNAWLFFVPFILLTAFAVMNLIVGLIVNSMQDAVEEQANEEAAAERRALMAALERIETRLAQIEAGPSDRGSE